MSIAPKAQVPSPQLMSAPIITKVITSQGAITAMSSSSADGRDLFEMTLFGRVIKDSQPATITALSAAHAAGFITGSSNFSLDERGRAMVKPWDDAIESALPSLIEAIAADCGAGQTQMTQDRFLEHASKQLKSTSYQSFWDAGEDPGAVLDKWGISSDVLHFVMAVLIKARATERGLIAVDGPSNTVALLTQTSG